MCHSYQIIYSPQPTLINFLDQNIGIAEDIWNPWTFKNLVTDKGDWDIKLNENTIRLIIVDYLLPELDGIDLISRIRAKKHYEHIPIILMIPVSKRGAFNKVRIDDRVWTLTKPLKHLQLYRTILS